MEYEKTTWTSGQKITAELLNHTENGIEGLNSQLTNLSSTVGTLNTDLTNLSSTVSNLSSTVNTLSSTVSTLLNNLTNLSSTTEDSLSTLGKAIPNIGNSKSSSYNDSINFLPVFFKSIEVFPNSSSLSDPYYEISPSSEVQISSNCPDWFKENALLYIDIIAQNIQTEENINTNALVKVEKQDDSLIISFVDIGFLIYYSLESGFVVRSWAPYNIKIIIYNSYSSWQNISNLGYDLVLSESFDNLNGENPVASMTISAGSLLQFCSQMEDFSTRAFPLKGAFVINNLDDFDNRKTILPLTDFSKDQDENEMPIYNLIFNGIKHFGSVVCSMEILVVFRPPNTVVSVEYLEWVIN